METLTRQVTRHLHNEHAATLALWSRVEAALAAGKADAGLLGAAAASLSGEIDRHFVFEEAELFPRLADSGEGDIASLLEEEHATIRAASGQFIALVRAGTLTDETRRLGLELAERLVSHVQKEEMSMLPALEDILDDATDMQLSEVLA